MTTLNPAELKLRARACVADTQTDTRKLVLIYCSAVAGLTLAASGLQMYLTSQIGSTGGLGGLGLRSVLQTVESILSYAVAFFGPIWQAGFLYAIIGMVRQQPVGPKSLTEGFRRFGRILLYTLDQSMLLMIVGIASVYIASILFSFSPWGTEFAEAMGPVLSDPNLITPEGTVNMELIPVEAMSSAALPLTGLLLAVFLPMYLFISYSMRMGVYLLMGGGHISAMAAIFLSWRLMKGHRWQMLKLDLSFWWYHGLMLLATVLGYLDVILSLAGIAIPMDANVMFFGTMVLCYAVELAVSLWKKCEVDAAYVFAFEDIFQTTRQSAVPAYPQADVRGYDNSET